MKTKRLFIIPIVVLCISIFASVVAFLKTNELEDGYIYIDQIQEEIVFDGEYFLLLGNLGVYSDTITVLDQTDGILITIFDQDEIIIKEYVLQVYEEGTSYDQTIVDSVISTEKNDVDNLVEHLLTISLEKGTLYEFSLEQTENHTDEEEVDVVFVNSPEHIVNMKNIMESVSFTTGIFTVIALFTVLAILYVKKD